MKVKTMSDDPQTQLAPPVFVIIREGARIGKRTDLNLFQFGGLSAVEVFNPRRSPTLMAKKDIELRAGGVYRVHTGLATKDIGLFAGHYQTTKEALLAAGIQVVRVDVDQTGELVLFAIAQANWTFDSAVPLIEVFLPCDPTVLTAEQQRIDSVAGAAVSTSVEPSAARETSVGKAVANEVSDEQFKNWLDNDDKASKQTGQPAPPVSFPPVSALPAQVKPLR